MSRSPDSAARRERRRGSERKRKRWSIDLGDIVWFLFYECVYKNGDILVGRVSFWKRNQSVFKGIQQISKWRQFESLSATQ